MGATCEGPCITIYRCECCQWTEPLKEWLQEILSEVHYSNTISEEIVTPENTLPLLTCIPTIEMCGNRIEGIPDENTMRNGIFMVSMKGCFH